MDNLISRQAAIDAILDLSDFVSVIELFEYVEEHDLQDKRSGGIIDAIDAVLLLPSVQPEVLACGEGELTVQPERKAGRWISVSADRYTTVASYVYVCSECGETHVGKTRYRPHCGVDMKGDE